MTPTEIAQVRLQCLNLAQQLSSQIDSKEDVLALAEKIAEWVTQ